jgi:predicted DNA-binding ribbon-helix-helix protein
MIPLIKSGLIKRSIVLHGHHTSLSLEDDFWTELKKIAQLKRVTMSSLVSQIGEQQSHPTRWQNRHH